MPSSATMHGPTQNADAVTGGMPMGFGLARAAVVAVSYALIAPCVSALEVGRSHFQFASDLANEGFEPFATSSVGKAMFGMKKDHDMYLCFSADTEDHAAERREKILAYLRDGSTDRVLPNIAVVCVLVQ